MHSHQQSDNSWILRWAGIAFFGLMIGGAMICVGILLVRLRSQQNLNAQPVQAKQGLVRH